MSKILPDDVPMRTVVRDTKLAQQLAEVPTIASFSSLQRIMEQNVDIPVRHGRGGRVGGRGLQGFSQEQNSRFLDGGPHGFLPSFSGASALPSFSSGELN